MSTTTTIEVPASVLRRLAARLSDEHRRTEDDRVARNESNEHAVSMVVMTLCLLLGGPEELPDEWSLRTGRPAALYPPDMAEDLRISRAEIRALRER